MSSNQSKEQITDYLKNAVSALQQETLSTDQPIGNCDASNAICHAIEAVFLHDLKGSSAEKNFWSLLKKYTHKTTRSQINELSQISTDIGRCRAWIRVTINDGALESYLRLIFNDTSTVKMYYRPSAYLRDVEHPDILLTYVQGLSEFSFNLSINSTVLNQWTSTALVLSGLLPYTDLPRPTARIPDLPHLTIYSTNLPSMATVRSDQPHPAAHHTELTLAAAHHRDIRRPVTRETDLPLPAAHQPDSLCPVTYDPDPHSPVIHSIDLPNLAVCQPTFGSVDETMSFDSELWPHNIDGDTTALSDHDNQLSNNETVLNLSAADNLTQFEIDVFHREDIVDSDKSSPSTPTSLLSHPDFVDPRPDIYRFAYNVTPISLTSNDGANDDGAAESQLCGIVKRDETVRDCQQSDLANSFDSLLKSYSAVPGTTPMAVLTVEELIDTFSPEHCYTPACGSNTGEITSDDQDDELCLRICNEVGLNRQSYQCHGCCRPVGMLYGKERLCDYDGFYYCSDCHTNKMHFLPSRVIYNWDFRPYPVCNKSYTILADGTEKPIIELDKINSQLYSHVPPLNEIMLLRKQLNSLKAYVYSCRQPITEDLLSIISGKSYLVETVHTYSLKDLQHVTSGILSSCLKKAVDFGIDHVYNCILCSQKGFICEICRHTKVIYPFEITTTTKCQVCKAVFHAECKTTLVSCPRCCRRKKLIQSV